MNRFTTRILAGALLLGNALLYGCGNRPHTTQFNLDFEYTNYRDQPAQWSLPDSYYYGYAAASDRNCRKHGGSSLRLEQIDTTKYAWARFTQELPDSLAAGREVELSGWIRTENVTAGFADLLLILPGEGDNGRLTADSPERGVRGTTEWRRISIRRQLPDSAAAIRIGGMLKGGGRAWFDRLEVRIDGRELCDPHIPAPKSRLTRREKAELRRYIHPLKGCDATDRDSTEMRIFDRLIGAQKVVALGENSHGASEIFRMKERLIRYLAIRQGFDLVAFEAEMGEVAAGRQWPGSSDWACGSGIRTRCCRSSNGCGSGTSTVIRSASGASTYSRPTGPRHCSAWRWARMPQPHNGWTRSPRSWTRAQIDPQLAREIGQGLDAIESRIDPTVPDAHDRAMLRQWITLIRQYLGMDEGIYWRDHCMAENLLWLRGQYPDSRIVLWGHNGHVSRAEHRMGRRLGEELGADYLNIGFTFHAGRCSIIAPGSKELQHDVRTAPPGTLEYLLHQLDAPFFLLDLRRMREERSPALEWINRAKFRHIGALRWEDEFWDERIADQFDYLIYIDRVTPSHLLF